MKLTSTARYTVVNLKKPFERGRSMTLVTMFIKLKPVFFEYPKLHGKKSGFNVLGLNQQKTENNTQQHDELLFFVPCKYT